MRAMLDGWAGDWGLVESGQITTLYVIFGKQLKAYGLGHQREI